MKTTNKILYLAPHLSTGGMPQFLLTRIQTMLENSDFEIYVVEWSMISSHFVVQRNKIKELLGNNFYELEHDENDIQLKENSLKSILNKVKPDIIHIDECPESFDSWNRMREDIHKWIYDIERPWKLVETNHNIWFEYTNKLYEPDLYQFCTPYHLKTFKDATSQKDVIEYPIIDYTIQRSDTSFSNVNLDFNRIHVLNVGLWTTGKNQKEGLEIAREVEKREPNKYMFHFVGNQAGNFKEYWEPLMKDVPSNVKIWGERDDVDNFMKSCDILMFNSTWECNPLVLREAIGYGMTVLSRNLPQYLDMFSPYILEFTEDLEENVETVIKSVVCPNAIPPKNERARFFKELNSSYENILTTEKRNLEIEKPAHFRIVYENLCKVICDHIQKSKEYKIEWWIGDDLIHFVNKPKNGNWYAPSQEYYLDFHIKIYEDGVLIMDNPLDFTNKPGYIEFDSSSLGDTLSWMGQMERAKEFHGFSKLYVRTFKNFLFDKEYYKSKGIYIVDNVVEVRPKFSLGCFYSVEHPIQKNKHKYNWNTIPLGKVASDRLGFDYVETRPVLASEFIHNSKKDKSVVVATNSTAQLKYWNNENGWQELIDWHIENGYSVKYSSKEETSLKNMIHIDKSLEVVSKEISKADYFIGISSGLSWFAWALNVHVILISGFTPEDLEFTDNCTRIINKNVCNGCWARYPFDKSEWNTCPDWKDTFRMFECTKTITSNDVIERILDR